MPLVSSKPHKPALSAEWVIHCDGATLGSNPSSEGGYGFSVYADGLLYFAKCGTVCGTVTNNVTELIAMREALKWCHSRGLHFPTIRTDSKFAVDQLTGHSQANATRVQLTKAGIVHYHNFLTPTYQHVSRNDERQSFTDMLANFGMSGELSFASLDSHTAVLNTFATWGAR